jgi:DNA polymerase-3 subunit beta
MLSNLEAKRVCMHLSAPNRAGLITPAEQATNEDILMLVMPVMLTNYA